MTQVCECNVYLCKNCGNIDGTYHGSTNCIGREYVVDYCDKCLYEEEEKK